MPEALITRGNGKIDSRQFFAKVEKSSKFCFVARGGQVLDMELVQAYILRQVWLL